MAASRLNDSQKLELLKLYRFGEATSVLAARFGCSPNTVIRAVKSLLLPEEYTALKLQRGRMVDASTKKIQHVSSKEITPPGAAKLALDNADNFSNEDEDEGRDSECNYISIAVPNDDEETLCKVAPLSLANNIKQSTIVVQPYHNDLLPVSVYLLVDKSVELDPKPLGTLAELGPLSDGEPERQALVLYNSPRAAKRQCSRGQRVIKVPDSSVFQRTIPFLLARGITRLLVEGGPLLALDSVL